jgi:hypothetical protein
VSTESSDEENPRALAGLGIESDLTHDERARSLIWAGGIKP